MTATIMLNPGLLTALPAVPRDAVPWSATVAAPGEPGTRLIVRGRVTASDGRTPVAGAALHVWQTDTRGYYAADGSLGNGVVFADLTSVPGDIALDGIKVDREGHVFVAGPGGVWVFAPDGRHLGTISPPEHVANMAWGDADGRTLYLTAATSLYRIHLRIAGAGTATVAAR